MTRVDPLGRSRRVRRALTACAVLIGMVLPALGTVPAHASDPLTFDHMVGRPRHATPEGVAVDGAGNVYVTDSANAANVTGDRVVKYSAAGVFMDVLAGPDLTSAGGSGTPGLLANPSAVAVAPDGGVYVLENGYGAAAWTTNEVSHYDGLGNFLGAWGGYGIGSGQFKTPQAIAVDSTGDVYVADFGNDRIQRFTSSGGAVTSWTVLNVTGVAVGPGDRVWTAGNNVVSVFQSDGTPVRSWSLGGAVGVTVDANGTAWVSLSTGVVNHYDASGTLLDQIGSGALSSPQNLAAATDGTLFVADTGHGRVAAFSTPTLQTSWSVAGITGVAFDGSTVTTTDGSSVDTFSANGGAGASWTSAGANGVAVDGAGDVWASSTDDVVREYDGSGGLLQTVNSLAMANPRGVVVAGGKLFVADTGNDQIARFATDGTSETSWAVTGVVGVAASGTTVYATDGSKVRTYAYDGTPGASWTSTGSTGIALDGAGNVWVASSDGVVRSYTAAGALRFTVGAGLLVNPVGVSISGSMLFVADAGDGTVKRFSTQSGYSFEWGQFLATMHDGVEDSPTGVATDAAGHVYVTNTTQDVIQEFGIDGTWIRDFGGTGSTFGLLQNPQAVAVGPSGQVYVADTTNQRIQRFSATGVYQLAWGSFGTAAGMFNTPSGIAVDASGNVYVADTLNHRIQKFDADGNFLTSWGGQGTSTGQFQSPHGLTVAGGSVWVADTGNNRIQRFSTTGTFQSAFGSGGSTDGKLSSPQDVAMDGEGTVWVTEKNNDRIQRFSAAGAYLSKLGSFGLDAGQFNAPTGIEIDASGNVLVADTTNNRVQVFVDANGPDVSFLSGPGTSTTSSSATFTFTANEPNATFECKLDGAPTWTGCVSGVSYSALAESSHTLSVRATDQLGHLGNPTNYTWSVDVTPPTVSMTQAPSSPSTSTSPTFAFTSSEANSTFLCKLDSATASSCTSPKTLSVTDGAHTFKVWSIDQAGNQSTTPATHNWTVDTTPPNVSIDAGPNGWSASTDATFKFSSTDASATFECHLDGAGYAPCTSPVSYTNLTAALHTFYVRGIDALGNVSADKTRSFTVDMADHRPDGLISTGKTYVGNAVYNATGLNQTKTLKMPANSSAAFTLRFENDGTDKDTYTVKGAGSNTGYTVSYWIGSTNYTTKIVGGTFTVALAPGAYSTLTMRVKVGSSGKSSAGFLVTVTSGHDPTKSDTVKAIVKRV